MLDIFPQNIVSVTYKKNKEVKINIIIIIVPKIAKRKDCSIEECNRKCDIRKNFLVVSTDFTCFAAKRKYKINGVLKSHSRNIIYLIDILQMSRKTIRWVNHRL